MTETGKIFLYKDTEHSIVCVTAKLISHAGHEALQAEQCSVIADNKGRCLIKTVSHAELTELYNNLITVGLNVQLFEAKKLR